MQAAKIDNKEIVRCVIEAANNHDLAAMTELFAPTLVSHMLFDSVDPISGEKMGYEAEFDQVEMEKYDSHERELFPEQHTTIDEMFDIGDDKVLSITTGTSTHKSGKKLTVKAMGIDRIADGKIVESWNLWDRLGYWQQLGLVSPTPELLSKLEKM